MSGVDRILFSIKFRFIWVSFEDFVTLENLTLTIHSFGTSSWIYANNQICSRTPYDCNQQENFIGKNISSLDIEEIWKSNGLLCRYNWETVGSDIRAAAYSTLTPWHSLPSAVSTTSNSQRGFRSKSLHVVPLWL